MGRVPSPGDPLGARQLPGRPLAPRQGPRSTPTERSLARLSPTAPFRLGAVVESHGWYQTAPFAWDPARGVLRRPERLPSGLVVVQIGSEGDDASVSVDRALSENDARTLVGRVRRMLQADVELGGFGESLAFDPGLGADLATYRAGRLLAGATLTEDVIKAICSTNITWRQAVGCIRSLASLSADAAFPEPLRIADAGEDRLRSVARVGYRAAYLVATARAAEVGGIDELERLAPKLDTPELAHRLRQLAGVGPSTAAFLCLLMGRYDLPLVDSAVSRVAAARWFGGRKASRGEIMARVAPAGRFAGLVLYWATMRGWHEEGGLGDPVAN